MYCSGYWLVYVNYLCYTRFLKSWFQVKDMTEEVVSDKKVHVTWNVIRQHFQIIFTETLVLVQKRLQNPIGFMYPVR